MFPDDFFGANFLANDYYPPEDAGGSTTPPVSVGDYTLRAWSFRRHRVVN